MFNDLSTLKTLLDGLPCYMSGAVYLNNGELIVPETAPNAFLVLDAISDTPQHGWELSKYTIQTFQLTVFSTTRTLALSKLASATALIPSPPWIPQTARDNGKIGIYFTFTQDWRLGD